MKQTTDNLNIKNSSIVDSNKDVHTCEYSNCSCVKNCNVFINNMLPNNNNNNNYTTNKSKIKEKCKENEQKCSNDLEENNLNNKNKILPSFNSSDLLLSNEESFSNTKNNSNNINTKKQRLNKLNTINTFKNLKTISSVYSNNLVNLDNHKLNFNDFDSIFYNEFNFNSSNNIYFVNNNETNKDNENTIAYNDLSKNLQNSNTKKENYNSNSAKIPIKSSNNILIESKNKINNCSVINDNNSVNSSSNLNNNQRINKNRDSYINKLNNLTLNINNNINNNIANNLVSDSKFKASTSTNTVNKDNNCNINNININNNNILSDNKDTKSQANYNYNQSISINQNSLWMGDIESWMNETEIKNLFKGIANVNSVKIMKKNNISLCYCFVEFDSPEIANYVLEKFNNKPGLYSDRLFKLARAIHSGKMAAEFKQIKYVETQVYVCDMDLSVTEEDLREFFCSFYSSVTTVKVVLDNKSKVSKGYGFVRFKDVDEANRSLVEMNGKLLKSKPIRVK